MNCTSGCTSKNHSSYGECVRSKRLRTGVAKDSVSYTTGNKFWTEIKEYRSARAEGIQPKSTQLADIRSAVALSRSSQTAVQDLG